MKKEGKLSLTGGVILIVLGMFFDAMKFVLDLLFAIGFVLDPFFITPIATFVFWLILNHYGVPMFSGKNWTSAWINEAVSLTPGVDALPDWTTYAIYLMVVHGRSGGKDDTAVRTQGIMK